MELDHIINITGTECPPDADEYFNKWYDELHVPANMKFLKLMAATRYRITPFKRNFLGDHAQYMTTYKFKDVAAFQKWNVSTALTEACEDILGVQQRSGFKMIWRVQYKSLGTWKNTQTHAVVTVVGSECPPENRVEFNTWYMEEHIPDIVEAPQIAGIVRYELVASNRVGVSKLEIEVKDYPSYLTFIFSKDLNAAEAYDESPERAAAYKDWLDIAKETGASMVWRFRYEPMRTWKR